MTNDSLIHQLTGLQEGLVGDLDALDEGIAARSQEQSEILVQLEALRRRLEAIAAESSQLRSHRESMVSLHHRAEADVVLREFALSAHSLVAFCNRLAEVSGLRERRERLLRGDPDLAAAVQNYREFERDRDRLLSALPAFYRSSLLQEHDRLRERVGPLLEGESQETRLLEDMVATLPIVVVGDREQYMVHWLMPFSAVQSDAVMAQEDLKFDLVAAVMTAVEGLARSEEWYFAELETGSWAGYATMSALAEYRGKATLAESTRDALVADLRDRLPGLQIEVAEISVPAWRYGLGLLPAIEAGADEQQGREVPISEDVPEVETPGSWYRKADIESWNRPLKIVAGSQWNQQARRLRTMLMRMIVSGMVGGVWVDADQLTVGLPQSHAEALREGIGRLVEVGILQPVNGDNRVTVNPSQIEEIQNLINRDMTEFWLPIINGAGPADQVPAAAN